MTTRPLAPGLSTRTGIELLSDLAFARLVASKLSRKWGLYDSPYLVNFGVYSFAHSLVFSLEVVAKNDQNGPLYLFFLRSIYLWQDRKRGNCVRNLRVKCSWSNMTVSKQYFPGYYVPYPTFSDGFSHAVFNPLLI